MTQGTPQERARLAEVERALRRATKAQPRSADAHFRLGLLLHQLGRIEEAGRAQL
jgi:Flp pilus assembly protein TadD